ncbi:MAG TPA: hypothetical protein PLI12_05975, partial [Acetobacteraceae bacterium]|nr:hypothetical protein [Acetobacteraceae bacterium]
PLRVLMLPPINWLNASRSYVPGTGPDPSLLDRMLADRGIEVTIIDPYGMPKNPLAHQHNLSSSLDPWGTIRVLLRERNFDLIVSVFEGSACSLICSKTYSDFVRQS